MITITINQLYNSLDVLKGIINHRPAQPAWTAILKFKVAMGDIEDTLSLVESTRQEIIEQSDDPALMNDELNNLGRETCEIKTKKLSYADLEKIGYPITVAELQRVDWLFEDVSET